MAEASRCTSSMGSSRPHALPGSGAEDIADFKCTAREKGAASQALTACTLQLEDFQRGPSAARDSNAVAVDACDFARSGTPGRIGHGAPDLQRHLTVRGRSTRSRIERADAPIDHLSGFVPVDACFALVDLC